MRKFAFLVCVSVLCSVLVTNVAFAEEPQVRPVEIDKATPLASLAEKARAILLTEIAASCDRPDCIYTADWKMQIDLHAFAGDLKTASRMQARMRLVYAPITSERKKPRLDTRLEFIGAIGFDMASCQLVEILIKDEDLDGDIDSSSAMIRNHRIDLHGQPSQVKKVSLLADAQSAKAEPDGDSAPQKKSMDILTSMAVYRLVLLGFVAVHENKQLHNDSGVKEAP